MQDVRRSPEVVNNVAWLIALIMLALLVWFFFSANQSASKQTSEPGVAQSVKVPVQLDKFRHTQL